MKFLRLRRRSEVEVLDLIKRHVEVCVSASDELKRAVDAKLVGNEKGVEERLKRLSSFEGEGDKLRRRMAEELAKGMLPPVSREDFMRLIEMLDKVADWSKDAGRVLAALSAKDLSERSKGCFRMLAERVNNCVHTLSNCVKLFYEDYEGASKECTYVETIEEEVDSLYVNTLKTLCSSEWSIKSFVCWIELAKHLEMVADSCEDTCDLIRIIMVSTLY